MSALILLLAIGTADPAHEIVLQERLPLAMLVISGNVELKSAFGVEELVHHASAALTKHTNLFVLKEVKIAGDEAIAGCEEKRRLSCWVHAVKTMQPAPRYLLAVSFFRDPNIGERVATLLIDIEDAQRIEDGQDRTSAGWEDRVEDGIFQHAAGTNDTLAEDSEVLGAYFDTLIARKLRADFERNHHFEPFGNIGIVAPRAGLEIHLDGTLVGTTGAGLTVLRDVTPGKRVVSVNDPKNPNARVESTVEVKKQQSATFSANTPLITTTAEDQGPRYNDLTFWTGVALAGVGVAITVWAAAADPRPEIFDGCYGPNCVDHRTFATLCELTVRDKTCLEKGGALAAPLGYSIALIGGTWAIGTALFQPDEDIPWIPFVIGLAAGIITYGVSAALDGPRPHGVE